MVAQTKKLVDAANSLENTPYTAISEAINTLGLHTLPKLKKIEAELQKRPTVARIAADARQKKILRSSLNETNKEILRQNESSKELIESSEGLRQKILQLETSLEESQTELLEERETSKALENTLQGNSASHENTKKQLRESELNANKEQKTFKSQISTLNTTIEKLNTKAKKSAASQKESVRQTDLSPNSQINGLESNITTASSQIKSLQLEETTNLEDQKTSHATNRSLSGSLTNLQSEFSQTKSLHAAQIKKLTKELSRRDLDLTKLSEATDRKAEYETKIKDLQRQLAESGLSKDSKIILLQTENEKFQQEFDSFRGQIKNLMQENKMIRLQRESLANKSTFFEGQSSDLKNELFQAQQQLAVQHQMLQQTLNQQQFALRQTSSQQQYPVNYTPGITSAVRCAELTTFSSAGLSIESLRQATVLEKPINFAGETFVNPNTVPARSEATEKSGEIDSNRAVNGLRLVETKTSGTFAKKDYFEAKKSADTSKVDATTASDQQGRGSKAEDTKESPHPNPLTSSSAKLLPSFMQKESEKR